MHLTSRWQSRYWADLTLILLFAMTGFLLGFLSLYLMQSLVARRFGWRMGWLFVAVVAGVSSFGIYLGRFLRWNTWDVLLNPIDLLRDVGGMAAHPLAHGGPVRFQLLFALFLFLAYLMLYALTHLRPPQFAALPASIESEFRSNGGAAGRVAQATCLCRAATSRAERELASEKFGAPLRSHARSLPPGW